MTRRFRARIPVYDWGTIRIIVTDNLKHSTLCRGEKFENERANYLHDPNDSLFTVAFDRKKLSNGGIAHEAAHIAWDVLVESGVRVTQKNHEALAYLVDAIVTLIHGRLKKAKIKIAG